jgi:hypothetical protein
MSKFLNIDIIHYKNFAFDNLSVIEGKIDRKSERRQKGPMEKQTKRELMEKGEKEG